MALVAVRDASLTVEEDKTLTSGERTSDSVVVPDDCNVVRVIFDRSSMTDLKGEAFRVQVEQSLDSGVTWAPWFGCSTLGGEYRDFNGVLKTQTWVERVTKPARGRLVRVRSINGGDVRTKIEVLCSAVTRLETAPRNSVGFDDTDTGSASGAATINFASSPVGTPTCIGVGVGWYNATLNALSSITYGAVAMGGHATADIAGFDARCAIYSLPNPASGAQTLDIDFAGNVSAQAYYVTVTGSDTATAFTDTDETSATGTGPSLTLTAASDEFLMDMLTAATATYTAGANQTQRMSNAFDGLRFAGSTQSGADGGVMSCTLGASVSYLYTAATFKVAAAAGGRYVNRQILSGVG